MARYPDDVLIRDQFVEGREGREGARTPHGERGGAAAGAPEARPHQQEEHFGPSPVGRDGAFLDGGPDEGPNDTRGLRRLPHGRNAPRPSQPAGPLRPGRASGRQDSFHRRAHESASTFSARSRCQQATARGSLSLSMTSRAGLSWSAGWFTRLHRTPRALLPRSARCFDSTADLS